MFSFYFLCHTLCECSTYESGDEEDHDDNPTVVLIRGHYSLSVQDGFESVHVSLQDILDVNVVAACGPPGGGRNPISPRLLKNFWSVHTGS